MAKRRSKPLPSAKAPEICPVDVLDDNSPDSSFESWGKGLVLPSRETTEQGPLPSAKRPRTNFSGRSFGRTSPDSSFESWREKQWFYQPWRRWSGNRCRPPNVPETIFPVDVLEEHQHILALNHGENKGCTVQEYIMLQMDPEGTGPESKAKAELFPVEAMLTCVTGKITREIFVLQLACSCNSLISTIPEYCTMETNIKMMRKELSRTMRNHHKNEGVAGGRLSKNSQ